MISKKMYISDRPAYQPHFNMYYLVIQPLAVKHSLRKLHGLACFRLEWRAGSPRTILFLQA